MDAGGEAVYHRTVGRERRDGRARRGCNRAENHGRALGDDCICRLYRDHRARLIVGNDELDRAAVDPAAFVRDALDDLERFRGAETLKCVGSGLRHHDVDFVG
jgi:hypothetical protein